MKIKSCLLAMLWPVMNSLAQSSGSMKPLSVGDTIPDIFLNNILNYKSGAENITAFKGKLVILDFWNTHCGPCVAALPKMQKLQEQFNSQLQIIPVTYEGSSIVIEFFKRKNNIYGNLPFITSDTILSRLFPHKIVPHEVWIDGKGIIKAFTEDYGVTAENISHLLNTGNYRGPLKQNNEDINRSLPLAWMPGFSGRSLLRQSMLTRRQSENYGSGISFINVSDSLMMLRATNLPVIKLFEIALEKADVPGFSFSRVVLENIRDSTYYLPDSNLEVKRTPEYAAWAAENTFYYELLVPGSKLPIQKSDALKIMYKDLSECFEELYHIKAELSVRSRLCLVLVNVANTRSTDTSKKPGRIYTFKERRVNELISLIAKANYRSPIPIIDGTGGSVKVTLSLSENCLRSIPLLRKELQVFGLDLVERTEDIEVMVIHPLP